MYIDRSNLVYIYIYIYIYLKASPLPPAPFLLVAGWVVAGIGLIEAWIHVNSKTMLPKWALRHMVY